MLINGQTRIKPYINNMRTVEIKDNKLKDLIEKKSALIMEGRAVSEEVEATEAQMKEVDDKLVAAEKLVDITDLDVKAKDITDRFNVIQEDMNALNKEVMERLATNVPKEFKEEYDTLKVKKDELEEKRNKIALNAQKYNDKIIPLTRKLMKPFLEDEFDDYEGVSIENDIIVGRIFNHVEDFKSSYRAKINNLQRRRVLSLLYSNHN